MSATHTRNPNNAGIFMSFGYTGFISHTGGDPGLVIPLFFDLKSGIGRFLLLNTNLLDRADESAMYKI